MLGGTQASQANYNDLAGLSQIRELAGVNQGAAYEEIGRQFESLLVHAMLKNMRSANRVWSQDSLLSSNKTEFYEDMLDQQLSLSMSQGDGIGLAKQFALQTNSAYGLQHSATSPAAAGNAQTKAFADDYPRATSLRPDNAQQAAAFRGSAGSRAGAPEGSGDTASEALQKRNFVSALMPLARRAAQQLNVEPELLLAQAALESGWGEHIIGRANGQSSHNLFGIKAHGGWQGDTAEVVTHEYVGLRKVRVVASFRAYDSFAESFADYVSFIQENERYATALAHEESSLSYPELLQQAGYATDPLYANKILGISARIVAQQPAVETKLSAAFADAARSAGES